MKQTAVDWLQQALEDTILTHEQIMQTIGLFEQAKEMEKEQIENAYDKGQESEWHKSMGLMGDHYYNETFDAK
jgi:hypothetical protein